MSRSYRLTPAAKSHLQEICDYIAADNARIALRVLDELETAFEQLAENPEMGHLREDLTAHAVKFWRVASYLIVYDPASEPLQIIAVLHGARDLKRILRK